jgi:shikimate dehydrogenase
MHESGARAQGFPSLCRLVDTDLMGEPAPSIADLLRFAGHPGFSGFNLERMKAAFVAFDGAPGS